MPEESRDRQPAQEPSSNGWRSLRYLPLALLLAAIAAHGVQIVAYDSDPQRSGAFGMFATVDIGATRRVIVTGSAENDVKVEIPENLRGSVSALKDAPSSRKARELVETLQQGTWHVRDGVAISGGSTRLDQVRLRVVALDAEGRTIVTKVLVDVDTADN